MTQGKGVSVLLWGGTLDLWGRRSQLEDLGLQGTPEPQPQVLGSLRLGMGGAGVARALGHLPPSHLLGSPIPSVSELSECDPGGSGQNPRWGPLWVPPGCSPCSLQTILSGHLQAAQARCKQQRNSNSNDSISDKGVGGVNSGQEPPLLKIRHAPRCPPN